MWSILGVSFQKSWHTVILGPCRPSEERSPNVRAGLPSSDQAAASRLAEAAVSARGKTRRHTRPLAETEVRFWAENEGESLCFQVMGGSPARDHRKLRGAERWGRWEQIPCPSHLGRVSQFIPVTDGTYGLIFLPVLARSGAWDRLLAYLRTQFGCWSIWKRERKPRENHIGFNMCSLVYSAAVPTAWWRR